MSRLSDRTSRRVPLVLAAALTALALAGCGASRGSTAAVVGDRQISISDLQQATRDIQGALGADASITQADVLYYMILAPYTIDAAAKRGLGVSANDVRLWEQQATGSTNPSQVPEFSSAGVETMRGALSLQKLGSLPAADFQQAYDQLRADLVAAGVHVNPRYGAFDLKQFDAKQVAIVQVTPNWILQTATPSPSPSAS